MANELLLVLHGLLLGCVVLGALRIGEEALVALICLLAVLANLFVMKQVTLWGLEASATDAYIIGAIFGLQLIQEYYGRPAARKAIAVSFFLLMLYALLTFIHLRYLPSVFDRAQPHYYAILVHMPRIALASLTAFLASQVLDYYLYDMLKRLFGGKYLVVRSLMTLVVVQFFDTVLFSFLGLYGILLHIENIILVSFSIKLVVIALTAPFTALSKKVIKRI